MLVDRGGTWYVDLVHPVSGERVRKSTKTKDKKLAELVHSKIHTDLFESQWANKPKGNPMTLQEGFEKAMKQRWSKKKSVETVEYNYKRLCGYMKPLVMLKDISTPIVWEMIEEMREEYPDSTINRSLSVLRTILTSARDDWELLGKIPKIPMLEESKGRLRWLQDGEEEIITEWCRKNAQEDLADLIEVLLDTGCRLNEVLSLQPKDVVLKHRHILLWDTKSGEWEVQPLTDRALRILEERTRIHGSPFKGISRSAAIHRFNTAKKNLGYSSDKELVLHTMRHTTASRLVAAGKDLKRIQQFMRHKDINTTLRYAKLNTEEKRRTMDVLN